MRRSLRHEIPAAPVDFLILTALDEEREVMLSKFRGAIKLDKGASDVSTCYAAKVRSRRRDRSEYQVIISSFLHMGPISATAQAVALVGRWRPRYVLLVGIACGVRSEVSLGDVLIASQVADYTLGKVINGRREVRWQVFPCGASLLDTTNNVSTTWQRLIKLPRPANGVVRRHVGVVASGGDVIADDDVTASYSKNWPKLVGIEMEAGGVAAGVHQTTDHPEFLMIKGVSDFGQGKHDPEIKSWRAYACDAAAAFAVGLIRSGPSRSYHDAGSDEQEETLDTEAAERRWQYIQAHPIRRLEILFLLKNTVDSLWFASVLTDTRLKFSPPRSTFKLGQVIAAASSPPNTRQYASSDEPSHSFWHLYQQEPGFWVRTVSPEPITFQQVAGVNIVAPWSRYGSEAVNSLQDLALLEKINISIPERALRVGIAAFRLRFVGDTFSFSVDAYSGVFDYFEEIARGLESARRVQERITHEPSAGTETREGSPKEAAELFYGPSYSGMQLLDMFRDELLGGPSTESRTKSRPATGFSGLVGEKGRAITFYPSMPESFQYTSEAENYRFTIPGLPMVRSAQRIAVLRKKLLGKSSDVNLYLKLAACLWIEGRHLEVVQCLETAIAKAPANALVHRTLAHTLHHLGLIHDALDHARTSLALEPESANGQMLAGACFSALGDESAALPFFEAAARLEPEDHANQYNLCATLVRLQRYSDAIEPAQRLADLKPADPDSALHLGALLDAQDLDERAQYYLKKATSLAPTSAEAHERLGMHFAKRHLHDEAVVSLLRAIELDESDMRWNLVGESYSALERWTEAEDAFRKAVAISPGDPALRVNLGVALANLNRVGEAKEQLAQILANDPHHELASSTLRAIEEAAASE